MTCLSVRGLKSLPQEQDQEVKEEHKNTFRSSWVLPAPGTVTTALLLAEVAGEAAPFQASQQQCLGGWRGWRDTWVLEELRRCLRGSEMLIEL